MSHQTEKLNENLTLHFDQVSQPVPQEYHWFFHGQYHTTKPRADERQETAWLRTMVDIAIARKDIRNDRETVLDPNAMVHVFAGSMSAADLEGLKQHYLKEWVLKSLFRVAGGRVSTQGDANAAVKALQLVAELTGLMPPRKTKARAAKDASGSAGHQTA